MQKRSLGRGLSDLLAGANGVSTRAVIEVEVTRLEPNPFQPRKLMEEGELRELAASIKESGILQPLVIREVGEQYQIVAGERRWRAAQVAGLHTVPCIVYPFDDRQALQIALVENLQRENLNAIEQARAFRQLIDEFGLTQEQVAERIGKSRPAVANCLRLLGLPAEVQDDIEHGVLTEGHGRALLTLKDRPGLLYEACENMVTEGLNVRQAEELVQILATKTVPAPVGVLKSAARVDDPYLKAATERLRQALATRVTIKQRATGGGTIRVNYHDAEELGRLLDALAPDLDI